MACSAHSSISLNVFYQLNVLHRNPLKVQCALFFCLTSSVYINAVRDSDVAAEVCLGHFMIK